MFHALARFNEVYDHCIWQDTNAHVIIIFIFNQQAQNHR